MCGGQSTLVRNQDVSMQKRKRKNKDNVQGVSSECLVVGSQEGEGEQQEEKGGLRP